MSRLAPFPPGLNAQPMCPISQPLLHLIGSRNDPLLKDLKDILTIVETKED